MIEKKVRKAKLGEFDQTKEDLAFWLSKTPDERVAAVEFLRRQYYGNSLRLQRTARLIKRSQS